MKITVVITEDGSGYYLADEEGNETEESVEWGMPLEFNGVSYLADVDESGENVSLSKVIDMAEGSFEVVSEGDEEDDDDEEGVASAAD